MTIKFSYTITDTKLATVAHMIATHEIGYDEDPEVLSAANIDLDQITKDLMANPAFCNGVRTVLTEELDHIFDTCLDVFLDIDVRADFDKYQKQINSVIDRVITQQETAKAVALLEKQGYTVTKNSKKKS